MKKRATIKDVARAAGVSVVTVSRVANTPELVQSETRERVRGVMREMGYSANIAARAMRTRTTRSIGFLTPDLASPINAAVAQAAEHALAAAGYAMLLTGSDHTVEREISALDVLRTRSVDGLILYISDEQDAALQETIAQTEIPVVLIDRAMPVNADLVWSDHAGPMSEAVRYLQSLGHMDVAFVQFDYKVRPNLERRRAFHEAVSFWGLRSGHVLEIERGSMLAENLPQELISGPGAPTAYLVAGTQLLRTVLQGLRMAGLRVPQDRSVIGIDTADVASLTTPETTSIVRDFADIGRTAAEFMLRRLAAPDAPQQSVLLPCEILLKGSCGAPRR